jgi:predicted flap endonuclease-1-like 5' DNA nuclease
VDLDACRAQSAQQSLEIERLNADLAAARASAGVGGAAGALAGAAAAGMDLSPKGPETGVDTAATRAAGGDLGLLSAAPQPSVPDDLTRLEGIGPKVNALLNEHGIYTFAQLAATSVERLRSILSSGGPRFSVSDPGTWPEQAQFARDGKWDALKAFTDTLKGGRMV